VVVLVVTSAAGLLRAVCSDDDDNDDGKSILGFKTNKRSRDSSKTFGICTVFSSKQFYLQLQAVFINPFIT